MTEYITQAWEAYDELMTKADPRTTDWPMMSSPLLSFVICISYVVLVTKILPKWMENKEPYNIRKIMTVFNIFMVGLSGYIFYEFLMAGWLTGYSLGCQPVDFSRSPKAMRMARVCWLFYISKFVELVDTLFFILRKKNNLVTFLHVFHHGIMPVSWWFGVKFVPGGFGTFHGCFNSLIHVVMYTYYGLAACGPAMQKYLWWKKYMTKFQMIQFICCAVHSVQLYFIECDYPLLFANWILSYSIIFLALFANFYIKAYKQKKLNRTKAQQNGSNGTAKHVSNGVKQD